LLLVRLRRKFLFGSKNSFHQKNQINDSLFVFSKQMAVVVSPQSTAIRGSKGLGGVWSAARPLPLLSSLVLLVPLLLLVKAVQQVIWEEFGALPDCCHY
jgi:hypothetical protein